KTATEPCETVASVGGGQRLLAPASGGLSAACSNRPKGCQRRWHCHPHAASGESGPRRAGAAGLMGKTRTLDLAAAFRYLYRAACSRTSDQEDEPGSRASIGCQR